MLLWEVEMKEYTWHTYIFDENFITLIHGVLSPVIFISVEVSATNDLHVDKSINLTTKPYIGMAIYWLVALPLWIFK